MKCVNCGWENADSAAYCVKCNSPLSFNSAPPQPQPTVMGQTMQQPSQPAFGDAQPIQPQVRQPEMPYMASTPLLCSRCGYPMSRRMQKCPNCYSTEAPSYAVTKAAKTCPDCGAIIDVEDRFCRRCGAAVDKESLAKRNIQGSGGDAFDSHGNYIFTLRPLVSKGEKASFTPITFTGSTVVLNRSNTDPENNTISPNQQAVLVNDKGKWVLENRSDAYTTFLRVMRPVEVKNGDILIMGSRAFEFKI